MAVELIEQAQQRDTLPATWLVGDEWFGRHRALLERSDAVGLWYLAEVPRTTQVWPLREPVERRTGHGPRRTAVLARLASPHDLGDPRAPLPRASPPAPDAARPTPLSHPVGRGERGGSRNRQLRACSRLASPGLRWPSCRSVWRRCVSSSKPRCRNPSWISRWPWRR